MSTTAGSGVAIVHVDAHCIVADKPSGECNAVSDLGHVRPMVCLQLAPQVLGIGFVKKNECVDHIPVT